MYQLLSEYEVKWALMNMTMQLDELSSAVCYTIGFLVAETILEQKDDSALAAYVPEAVTSDAAAFALGWSARFND